MNEFIQLSLNRTFKQDKAQRQVSMQIPDGPQRIRGLAGTGKTVVLCLKAALTALRLPNYKILYLFNTQSLYHTIEKQIGDYYAKESKSSLPQDSIDILHAWGGRTTGMGLYLKICDDYGLAPKRLSDIPYGEDGLQVIYRDLEKKIGDKIKPIYDLILVDEAQDFPNEVFNIVYRLSKKQKRIVVAYDDFQSLKSLRIREFSELFGKETDGSLRFPPNTLEGKYEGGVEKDFVLPNCYRNPRNVLMVAHGVAMGLKRKEGVVDCVDKVSDWNALGYQVNLPKNKEIITAGDKVEVERLDKNSTNLLESYIKEEGKSLDKLVQVNIHESIEDEINFIANKINILINQQDVSPHEIYVIALETKNCETYLKKLRSNLNHLGISSIMPGFVESARYFYEKNSVTLTTPFKAKGNEANVVFVANCESVVSDYAFNKRNAFFVSVTRSRGWCYISGIGDNMKKLEREIADITQHLPKLSFIRPDDDQIARSRLILTTGQSKARKIEQAVETLKNADPDYVKEVIRQMKLEGLD